MISFLAGFWITFSSLRGDMSLTGVWMNELNSIMVLNEHAEEHSQESIVLLWGMIQTSAIWLGGRAPTNRANRC